MAGEFYELVRELNEFSKAKASGWTARGSWPQPSPAADLPMLKSDLWFGLKRAPVPRPAPRPETREQKLARLHARVRAAIPDVMAKAMADFAAGRITATDISRVEAQLNRMRAIVS